MNKNHPFKVLPGELWLIVFENSTKGKGIYKLMKEVHPIFYHSDVTRAFSYTVKEYFESGQLKDEEPYVDGKPHGTRKGYYESGGQLWYERTYVDGKYHGAYKEYYESGQLNFECTCVKYKIMMSYLS